MLKVSNCGWVGGGGGSVEKNEGQKITWSGRGVELSIKERCRKGRAAFSVFRKTSVRVAFMSSKQKRCWVWYYNHSGMDEITEMGCRKG